MDDIWRTIQMTGKMERQTFEMMTSFYKSFGGVSWNRNRLEAIDDLLNEVLLNTIDFIAEENSNGKFSYASSHYCSDSSKAEAG